MSQQVEYEKTTYSTFERLIYLFLIPALFSAVLTIVMLQILGVDVLDRALIAGNKIPIVEKIIPDPKTVVTEEESGQWIEQERAESEARIASLEADLMNQSNANYQKELELAELQTEIAELREQLHSKALEDDEYLARIQQLAAVYANMRANRAAPIFENLTLHERVLVLNEMRPDDQMEILERLDPATAAETSILLKDQFIVKDLQIAALQERLHILENEQGAERMAVEELALTFTNMTPGNAALVLLEMMKINESQVIGTIRAMNVQARSQVLNAMTEISESEAARLLTLLGSS